MAVQVAFFGLILLTFFWRNLAPARVRSVAVPWAFAILIMNVACASFYWGPIRAAYVLMNYSAYIIMLDGFDFDRKRNNPAWTAFLVFWGYMIISGLFGYYKLGAMFYWTNIFLTTFCCGYFTARWVLRNENGLGKLLFSMACVSCITMFLYAKHGSFSAIEVGTEGRAGFDMDTLAEGVKSNVNYTAMVMLNFIPFLIIGLLRTIREKKDRLVKWMSAGALLLSGLVLVRTGARNGAVGLLPSVWYFLFSTTNRVKRRKRIGIFIMVTIVFVPSVIITMKGAESIRFVRLSGMGERFGGTKSDDITSGRMSMWMNNLKDMTPIQIMVGHGLFKNGKSEEGKLTAGNAHSIYMTVLYNSGIVGLLLLVIFFSISFRRGMKMGDRGRIALLMIGTWLFVGTGESWGMIGGATALLGGFGIGLLSHRVAENSEFGERDVYLPVWGPR